MLRNYFLVALRNFRRNKLFSLIHILGLSIGLSASIVIFIIARYEFTFDKFESDSERIYRVVMNTKYNGFDGKSPAVPAPLSSAIDNEVTGVTLTIPVMQFQGDASAEVVVPINDVKQRATYKKQSEIIFTNNEYLTLLPFEWLAGNSETALTSPFSTVLTKARAVQYFPGLSPDQIIGKELIYNKDLTTYVTGVVSDLEENTDFTSIEFISFPTISKTVMHEHFMMENWNDWMAYSKVYLKLDESNKPERVEAQLAGLVKKYRQSPADSMTFKLQALADIHFNQQYAGFGQRTANKSVIYGLLIIALFLLLLGCINFINLSTAQAANRAREIGIRKTVGGIRKQLIVQFLVETFCITMMSTILSIGIAPILLQQFSDFIPPGVSFDVLKDLLSIAFLVGLTLTVSMMSGFYPSLILSSLQPIKVLRNSTALGSTTRKSSLRRVLTVGQFVVAQFFIIAALMVSKQINFSINKDLGYRKDAILNFDIPRDTTDRVQTLKNKIASINGVEKVSLGFLPPAIEGFTFQNLSYNNGKEEINVPVQVRWGDSDYLPLYNISIVAGRNVHDGKDVNEALINESYAKELGFTNPADAIGEKLKNRDSFIPIVGIMKDFHASNTHLEMGPVYFKASSSGSFYHVALGSTSDGSAWQPTISSIEAAFHQLYPEAEFKYSFFDETIANFYRQEQNTSRLLRWAMGLSITISCMGLLGLVIYTSQTRKKEIGIRKILGASVTMIVSLLSKEFVILILVASALASPLAWWSIDKWLESFAYKTEMSWWIFAFGAIGLLIVAVITLSFQTVGTARSNPVDSLRSE